MKIEFLETFILLNRYKNFSQLANIEKISQSTLSHRISQLEKEIGGIKLINRTTRKFKITEAGKIFLNYAEKIVPLFKECMIELEKFNENSIENIVISASTLPGSHILPKFIANFRGSHQNVNFKILINNSRESLDRLLNNTADFAGIGSFMDLDKDQFDYVKIGTDKFVFICSPKHEILDREDFSLKEIIKYPFIMREKGSGTRNIIEKNFAEFSKLNITLKINDNDSIISAVSDSNHFSIISEVIARKAENANLIHILSLKPTNFKRDVFFVKLKNVKLKRLKEKFWNYLET